MEREYLRQALGDCCLMTLQKIFIGTTSFADETQSQFKYMSVQVIRQKGFDHHKKKAVSKNHLEDR